MVPGDSGLEQAPVAAGEPDSESAGWLRELARAGPQREAALARLHAIRNAIHKTLWSLHTTSAGQLRFAGVTRQASEHSPRLRDSAAVVTGWTRMVMHYQGDELTVRSRTPTSTRATAADGA